MLPVKYEICTVSAADFNEIDLIQIEFPDNLQNLSLRQASLVILTGHQIFDRYLFKNHVRHICAVISIHVSLLNGLKQFFYRSLQVEQRMFKVHACFEGDTAQIGIAACPAERCCP